VNRRRFLTLATAPFVLRAASTFGSTAPRGLVTCDTESRIAVVDLAGGRVLGSIPVAPGPKSIERLGRSLALVCHTGSGRLTIVDGRTSSVRHVLHGFEAPRYTARHPDGAHAFVSDSGRGLVAAVDIRRGQVLGTVELGGPARHLSLAPDGRTLWTSLGSSASQVAVVDVSDPARPRFVRHLSPPFLAHDVGFFPDGRRVWVTAGTAGEMAMFAGRQVLRSLPADPGPQHVTFGSGVAYVTSGVAGRFRVQSLADGSIRRETRIPVGSYNVQSGPGGLVLTPSLAHGTLCILDAAGSLLRTVQVSSSSHDACFVF
jgi:DNA-binding beta-propeller fold protein YncE